MTDAARSLARRPRVGATAALALVALAGCGQGGPAVPAPAWSAVDEPRGADCRYAIEPGSVPTFGELTRAGTIGSISMWGRDMEPADTVELSIRYGDDGWPQWVRTVHSTVEAERATALERMVLGAVTDSASADWGVRVLVAGGAVTAIAPSVICDPVRERFTATLDNLSVTQRVYEGLYQLGGRPIPVQVSLDDLGRVLDVQLERRTGNRAVDLFIADFVRNSRYEPKRHDGLGVATTHRFDVRFPVR